LTDSTPTAESEELDGQTRVVLAGLLDTSHHADCESCRDVAARAHRLIIDLIADARPRTGLAQGPNGVLYAVTSDGRPMCPACGAVSHCNFHQWNLPRSSAGGPVSPGEDTP
jgi:hypothetical protein